MNTLKQIRAVSEDSLFLTLTDSLGLSTQRSPHLKADRANSAAFPRVGAPSSIIPASCHCETQVGKEAKSNTCTNKQVLGTLAGSKSSLPHPATCSTPLVTCPASLLGSPWNWTGWAVHSEVLQGIELLASGRQPEPQRLDGRWPQGNKREGEGWLHHICKWAVSPEEQSCWARHQESHEYLSHTQSPYKSCWAPPPSFVSNNPHLIRTPLAWGLILFFFLFPPCDPQPQGLAHGALGNSLPGFKAAHT